MERNKFCLKVGVLNAKNKLPKLAKCANAERKVECERKGGKRTRGLDQAREAEERGMRERGRKVKRNPGGI